MRAADGAVLCIIDSFRAAWPDVKESDSSARKPLDMLGRISEKTDCSFLLIHHSRKTKEGDGIGGLTESIRGSSALFDALGSALILCKTKVQGESIIYHNKARTSGITSQPLKIRIDDNDISLGRIASGECGLSVTAESCDTETIAKEARQLKDAQLAAEVIETLKSSGVAGIGSVESIAKILKVSKSTTAKIVQQLIEEGKVASEGSTKSRRYVLVERFRQAE